jgi:DDE superfamily endonuclease
MIPSPLRAGGLRRLTNDTPPGLADHEVLVVQGGVAYRKDRERRLAPAVERAEPRQRAMASRRGLRSPAARKNSWPWAEGRGETTPDAVPHRRRRALWDPEAVREALGRAVIQPRGDSEAVRVLEETGLLNKGRPSAGGARQYRGTAGRIEQSQLGGGWAMPVATATPWGIASALCLQRGPSVQLQRLYRHGPEDGDHFTHYAHTLLGPEANQWIFLALILRLQPHTGAAM